ncbi:hypothetical protein BH10ACI2_BH10ACI2_19530 [soil metagenome]
MTNFTRRDFFKTLAAATAGLALAENGFGFAAAKHLSEPFEFLVVGDSIIWGQGLEEKDKFYTYTAEWLREGAFGGPRHVSLKVKAHSGSTLKFHPDEAEKYKKAGRDESYYYKPEVNVGFPSIWKQIETGADEYKVSGVTRGADLIMLTGGITDITVSKVLDPFDDKSKLTPLIEKYLLHDMHDVIDHAAKLHPNALIAVVGYFPMLSPQTRNARLMNNWLESMSFPRILKPFANNPVTRQLFFNRLKKKGIERSRIWFDQSNRCMLAAIARLNVAHGKQRAVFVPTPITEDTCLETPDTLLFRMGKNGVTDDPLYRSRTADCDIALPELKRNTDIKYPVRLCEIAAVGHPNAAGSRAYAEAIKTALLPSIRQKT